MNLIDEVVQKGLIKFDDEQKYIIYNNIYLSSNILDIHLLG